MLQPQSGDPPHPSERIARRTKRGDTRVGYFSLTNIMLGGY